MMFYTHKEKFPFKKPLWGVQCIKFVCYVRFIAHIRFFVNVIENGRQKILLVRK